MYCRAAYEVLQQKGAHEWYEMAIPKTTPPHVNEVQQTAPR